MIYKEVKPVANKLKENIDNYRFYNLKCKEESAESFYLVATIIISNTNEIRILGDECSFFYCNPIYCIEFVCRDDWYDQSTCIFEIQESISNDKSKIILHKRGVHEDIFKLTRNKKSQDFLQFAWEKFQQPKLINRLVFGWDIITDAYGIRTGVVSLLVTTDGLIRILKNNLITKCTAEKNLKSKQINEKKDEISQNSNMSDKINQEELVYKIRSEYHRELEYEIIFNKDQIPYINTENNKEKFKIESLINNKYLVLYESAGLMEFWIEEEDIPEINLQTYQMENQLANSIIEQNKNQSKEKNYILQTDQPHLYYNGHYWIESTKGTFLLPFKINGYRLEFNPYCGNYDYQEKSYMNRSAEKLLADFEMSEDLKIIKKSEEMTHLYTITFGENYRICYLIINENEIRLDSFNSENDVISTTNNTIYTVLFNKGKFFHNNVQAKFSSFGEKLILMTEGFSAQILGMGKFYLDYFNKLKPAKLMDKLDQIIF